MASIVLIPNGVGDETAQAGFVGAPTAWQTCVSQDEDATYTYESGALFQRDLFNLEEPILPDAAPITRVEVRAYVRGTWVGTGIAQTSIKTNGQVYDGVAQDVTTSWTLISTEYSTNPQTGLAWTKSEIQGLQAGSSLKRPKVAKVCLCTFIQVIVYFTISTQTFYPIVPTQVIPAGVDNWFDCDASGLAPVNATGVILHYHCAAGTSRNFGIRKNGSTDDRHRDLHTLRHGWCMIGVDENRIFEAYVESATADVPIYVVGYTMAGVTFATNATQKIPGGDADWWDLDCSVEAPNATGLIWEIENILEREFGLRQNTSTDDRHFDNTGARCKGAIIGCDENQICDGYTEDGNCDLYLVGYTTDGAAFITNATDLSLGDIGSWEDLAALPATGDMGFIEVVSADKYDYDFRENGTAEEIYYGDVSCHVWGIVDADANRVIEGKIENIGVDFFLVGYSTIVPIVRVPRHGFVNFQDPGIV